MKASERLLALEHKRLTVFRDVDNNICVRCCAIAIGAVFVIFVMAYGLKPSLIAFGIATPIILLALLGGWLIAG